MAAPSICYKPNGLPYIVPANECDDSLTKKSPTLVEQEECEDD